MKKTSLSIKHCPNCGSDQIKQVCRDWSGVYKGQTYVVPELTFYECPVCGERVFPPEAMMKIEVHSPAYTRYSRKVSRSGAAKAVPASSSVER